MLKIISIIIIYFIFSFYSVYTYAAKTADDQKWVNTKIIELIKKNPSIWEKKVTTPDGKSEITVNEALTKWYLTDGKFWPTTEAVSKIVEATAAWWASSPAAWWNTPAWWTTSPAWWWTTGLWWATSWPNSITSKQFMIDTWEFSIGWSKLRGTNAKGTINKTLWVIIQKLMIALWVIALLIMTIWAGYMVTFHGSDEFLNKGKSIFIWWITALIVALSSYYLVNLVGYILYK